MARDKSTPTDDETAQPALVPLSVDELQEAGRTLAARVKELEDLKALHTEKKTEMRADEKRIAGQIASIASTIRTQGR